jgi:hypothetical protein
MTITNDGSEEIHPVVAFFHFSASQKFGNITSAEAFRALAAQLIHIHRNERLTMDALAILFDRNADGQQFASDDAVDVVLRILLQHCPTYLVIDGVDECSDSQEFLSALWKILVDEDC